MKNLIQTAEYALSALKTAGADDAQVSVSEGEVEEFNVEAGEFSLIRSVFSSGISIKVIKDKKHLLRFINIQRSILDNISNIIHSGSYLYYITCTLNPCENEEAIYAFLHKRPQFKLICSYHTPHEHSWLEGMYGAKLQKI